ncbi:hypothetical protein I4641_07705 [Waterburya agarophytonicola K14]|uniref:Secreted protein n=1 Tax=Waterburya agarophytonicola KI4 TaxID=2874699 RepID=A0A964FFF5_9CYAN|nr:hypothetical protein [Waterburya agarophytonicola]MCC0176861.1 hypothetical protein [Waterburya agarophytonicola KI4]
MKILVKAIRWTSLISLPAFLLAIPSSPAMAGSIGNCADNLMANGVAKSAAAAACSDALNPGDLASCVDTIKEGTDIKGNDALQSCYRVRRPDELASCVTTVSSGLEKNKSMMALDSCRRSLLPERYAECTVDLTGIGSVSSEEAMKSCIAAEFNPSEVAPESTEK